jgi:hypothetical protein
LLPLICCVVLAGATLAVFWPVLHYPFINLDDPEYVTQNPHLLGGLSWTSISWAFTTGYAANWHPLTWLSHMLDVQLFGENSGLHHLTSLLFHVTNTILLFLVLHRMTGTLWRSACVAGIFALHPLHVESVAWVAERKDVLSGFFFMFTLLAYGWYVKQRSTDLGSEDRRQKTEDRGQNAENRPWTGSFKSRMVLTVIPSRLRQVAAEISGVKAAARARFLRRVTNQESGAAEPVKAFGGGAWLRLEHAFHRLAETGIAHKQNQHPAQMIAIERFVPRGMLLECVERQFPRCQFVQTAPHQVRLTADQTVKAVQIVLGFDRAMVAPVQLGDLRGRKIL